LQSASKEERRLNLGSVPEPPDHRFVGRSRELLVAERWLALDHYIVLRGEGGEGKTTLAVELVRWLVRIGRFERAAFVSLDHHPDARAALFELGPQLLPGFVSKATQDLDNTRQLLKDVLGSQPTVLVFDNMETVLQDEDAKEQVLDLAKDLMSVDGTRLVFTSREYLPEPFDENDVDVSRHARLDAVQLVANVLDREDRVPYVEDEGESKDEIVQLVDAVQGHARSLVLLAPIVAERGVKAVTDDLRSVLEELEERHPRDRERSLFASVELSLRRLPGRMRERIRPLAMFHGGGLIPIMVLTLGLGRKFEEGQALADSLIGVGLAEMRPCRFLRLHPALGPMLDRELSDAERHQAQEAWIAATETLVSFLYEESQRNSRTSATLAILELPNLLALLNCIRLEPPVDG